MKKGFDIILKQIPGLEIAFSDRGNEFALKVMLKYFENKGIKIHNSSSDEIKASMAERRLRTLKHRLYRYFTSSEKLNWVEVLPDMINGINNSKCRVTKMSANEMTKLIIYLFRIVFIK